MIFKWLNESKIMMEGDKIEIFAPTGMGERVYENLSIERRTVKNIRAEKKDW